MDHTNLQDDFLHCEWFERVNKKSEQAGLEIKQKAIKKDLLFQLVTYATLMLIGVIAIAKINTAIMACK